MMFTTAQAKQLARRIDVDFRSIKAELAGKCVRGHSGERIRAALAALDLKPLISATGVAENRGAETPKPVHGRNSKRAQAEQKVGTSESYNQEASEASPEAQEVRESRQGS